MRLAGKTGQFGVWVLTQAILSILKKGSNFTTTAQLVKKENDYTSKCRP